MEKNDTDKKIKDMYVKKKNNEEENSFQIKYAHSDKEGIRRRLSEYSKKLGKGN